MTCEAEGSHKRSLTFFPLEDVFLSILDHPDLANRYYCVWLVEEAMKRKLNLRPLKRSNNNAAGDNFRKACKGSLDAIVCEPLNG